MNELETLDYFVSSFQLYLKRNKEIAVNFKRSSETFLRFFKKLLIINRQVDYKEKDWLRKKIADLTALVKTEKTLANKTWLLQEINKVKL